METIIVVILGIVLFGGLIGVLVFSLMMIRITTKAKKKQKQEFVDMKSKGMICHDCLAHISGLPLDRGVFCNIYSMPGKIEIRTPNAQFNLDKSKIKNIEIKTDVKYHTQYTTTRGRAVPTETWRGPGYRYRSETRERQKKTTTYYLVFEYIDKDINTYTGNTQIRITTNTTKHIIFNASGSPFRSRKFVEEFQRDHLGDVEGGTPHIVDL